MHQSAEEKLIASIFSDETALFRTPAEPETGDEVSIRLRLMKNAGAEVYFLTGMPTRKVQMQLKKTDAVFDWYETRLRCGEEAVFYSFLIVWRGKYIHCRRSGASWTDSIPAADPAHAFSIHPGFHVPAWSRGAVQYQILTDRFYNGDPRTDVREREVFYSGGHVHHADSWDEPPQIGDYRVFYGGDLQGVLDKLDYLQELGVEAIYFNPLFVSPSSHKYDTQDYGHIDPHLTRIVKDLDAPLDEWEQDNREARQYILRTTDRANLEASDAFFADFCQELHRRGMKIILDGVFNHCGSFHRWMNREGVYKASEGYWTPGAFESPRSPYRYYFKFLTAQTYEAWWNVETLPKLYYESSGELCEEILRVAEKWASPPYSIDGWRLDVGADLGHSREFNHLFWREFRRRVKRINPELLILAEHYGDPGEWLQGNEWDSVMNYDAFMEPVTGFLTGMEKHSDYRRDDLYQNGEAFFAVMQEAMCRLPGPSLQCAMNELSNHDHSRFLTRTNRWVGRLDTAGSDAAAEEVQVPVLQEAVVIQMTWPGAPTIYYGDEAGQVGWADPDNRRTYPWGHENRELIELHKALIRLREEQSVLKTGSIKPLSAGRGLIAYARFNADTALIVVCNNLERARRARLMLRDVGVLDGSPVRWLFKTNAEGFQKADKVLGHTAEGGIELMMEAQSALILLARIG